MECFRRHKEEDNIWDESQDDYDEQEQTNANLMLMDNIEYDSAYEFNLSSREPSLVPALDREGFDGTQSSAIEPIDKFPNWTRVSVKNTSTKTPGFDHIRQKIKDRLGIQPYRWQTSVILDALNGADSVVKAGTGSGKSLAYQGIPIVNDNAIVLVISPTIALIKDQVSLRLLYRWLLLKTHRQNQSKRKELA